jgi:large subunit ribosomal protein L21
MYGVVKVKGHQYKVQAGDLIDVEKIDAEEGSEVVLDEVLFIGGDDALVGSPLIEGAKVTAKIVRQAKDRKKLIFRRMVGKWEKLTGHRQNYSSLFITGLEDGKGGKSEVDSNSERAKKYLK